MSKSYLLGSDANGWTTRDVPIIISRSHFSKSWKNKYHCNDTWVNRYSIPDPSIMVFRNNFNKNICVVMLHNSNNFFYELLIHYWFPFQPLLVISYGCGNQNLYHSFFTINYKSLGIFKSELLHNFENVLFIFIVKVKPFFEITNHFF